MRKIAFLLSLVPLAGALLLPVDAQTPAKKPSPKTVTKAPVKAGAKAPVKKGPTGAASKTTGAASKTGTRPNVAHGPAQRAGKAPAGGARSNAPHTVQKAAPQKKSTGAAKRATVRPTPRAAYQSQPSPDRYREIQQALKERGYLQSEADGNWGESSLTALKKFQQDQNLPPDGKLSSLSLIALGLGPKRMASANPQQTTRPQ